MLCVPCLTVTHEPVKCTPIPTPNQIQTGPGSKKNKNGSFFVSANNSGCDHVGDPCELAAQQAGADHRGCSRFPRSREAAGDVSRRLRVCRQVWRMCAPERAAVYLWSTTSRIREQAKRW